MSLEADLSDDFFMSAALEEAQKAFDADEVPIGAVAVENGIIIARSHNQVEAEKSVSAHAEFILLKQLEYLRHDWRMTGITIYVTKEPCPMCAGMLVNSRFSRIVFGVCDPAFGGCGGAVNIPDLPGALFHAEVKGGVKSDEAKALIQKFFRLKRA